ncbi:MAG: hypothetical protein HY973_00695 [Candidatus Kerfeldbacteria bacterium]|nr:hypothetical protein [Candidatus Kerfeldbacteria bacterium]
MSKVEKILLILLGAMLISGIVSLLWGWQNWRKTSALLTAPGNQPLNYNQAKQAEDPSNPCAPPAGYTEESWREHMGHHPEQYKQCLGN